jgi:uncharacterized protein (DUF4415 family)
MSQDNPILGQCVKCGKNLTSHHKCIDTSDIPELTEEFWKNAVIGGPLSKQLVSIRIDKDVIERFKKHKPNGWQTHMNKVLKSYADNCLPS